MQRMIGQYYSGGQLTLTAGGEPGQRNSSPRPMPLEMIQQQLIDNWDRFFHRNMEQIGDPVLARQQAEQTQRECNAVIRREANREAYEFCSRMCGPDIAAVNHEHCALLANPTGDYPKYVQRTALKCYQEHFDATGSPYREMPEAVPKAMPKAATKAAPKTKAKAKPANFAPRPPPEDTIRGNTYIYIYPPEGTIR